MITNEQEFQDYLKTAINLNNAASVIIDRAQNMGISGYKKSSDELLKFFDELYTKTLMEVLDGLYDKDIKGDLEGWDEVANTMLEQRIEPCVIKRFYDVLVEFLNICERTCIEIRHKRLNNI